MKKLLFYVTGLAFVINLSSCKKGNDSNDETTSKDTVEVQENIESTSSDSIKKRLSTLSLNQLLELYNKNKSLESNNKLFFMLVLDEIEDLHKIPSTEYKTITENFWGKGIEPLTKKMDKNDITAMIGNAKDTDYIEFTFTDKKDAVFTEKIVPKHSFDTKLSCFPALIFKKMLKDADFELLEITKADKNFTDPSSVYKGHYLMAVLKYTDKKGTIQHFDIVDDPTIDYKGFKKE